MDKVVTRSAMLAATVAMLSGCQILGVHRLSSASSDRQATISAPATSLQTGRLVLTERRWGAAIEAFNIAVASGEDPAAAYNGLAIAYSRLGRDDLAYRFFKKAAMSDPSNPVYTRNFAMLVNSPNFTLRTMAEASPRPTLAPVPQPTSGFATNDRGARLVRDSSHQLSLITVDPSSASPPATRGAATTGCHRAKGSAVCRTAGLPQVGSRRPAAVASVDPVGNAPPNAQRIAAIDPSPVAHGKSKTFDLSALPRSKSGESTSKAATLDTSGKT